MSYFLMIICSMCLVSMFASGLICLYRMIIGPRAGEQAVALDSIVGVFIGIICILCIVWREPVYFDAVWILTIIGFIGSAAIAHYLQKGRVF